MQTLHNETEYAPVAHKLYRKLASVLPVNRVNVVDVFDLQSTYVFISSFNSVVIHTPIS